MILSLDQQIEAMKTAYPNLTVVRQSDRACIWFGGIRPNQKTFYISIYYRPPIVPETFTAGIQPRVQLLSPILERHYDFEEGPIPHVYRNDENPLLPYLCLFDSDANEWTPEHSIAETTIPWTERWLINYEFWIATGKWAGGGRHIVQRKFENPELTFDGVDADVGKQ